MNSKSEGFKENNSKDTSLFSQKFGNSLSYLLFRSLSTWPLNVSQKDVIEIINSLYPELKVIVASPLQIQNIMQHSKSMAFFKYPISIAETNHITNLFETSPSKEQFKRHCNIDEQTRLINNTLKELGINSEEEYRDLSALFIPQSNLWDMVEGTHELAHGLYFLNGLKMGVVDSTQFQTLEDLFTYRQSRDIAQRGYGPRLNEHQRRILLPEALMEAEVNQALLSSKNLLTKVGSLGLIDQASYGSHWLRVLLSSNAWEPLGVRELSEK